MTCVSWYSWCFVWMEQEINAALKILKKQEQISCLTSSHVLIKGKF